MRPSTPQAIPPLQHVRFRPRIYFVYLVLLLIHILRFLLPLLCVALLTGIFVGLQILVDYLMIAIAFLPLPGFIRRLASL